MRLENTDCGRAMAPQRSSTCARFLFAFAVAALALGGISISGCGTTITAANNVESITISPTSATVSLGAQTDFSAQVTVADTSITTNTNVTWQVNGADGGSSSSGTIVASAVDTNVGIYTAPTLAPSTSVSITAIITETPSSSSTSTKTITSNVATVSFGGVAGLSITPGTATVGGGGTEQFEAMMNSAEDSNARYSISSSAGGNIGTIDATTGLYTAPDVPPPGGQVTITATDGTQTATATATIVYSDASLTGPFALSYSGNTGGGFFAVAGRFASNGQGAITAGVEDMAGFAGHVASTIQIQANSTYKVGPDGRTTATVQTDHGTQTWQFVLTSSQHALLIAFDNGTTGSGTVDQQNVNDINSNPIQVISGPYVFSAAGGDSSFNPMAVAGQFTANGSGSAQAPAIVDVNDNGTPKTSDTSLTGTYQFDANNPGTGRGTLSLSSTSTGSLEFAFYVIDNTHLHIVEIDGVNYLAGDIYSELAGPSYTTSALAAAPYAFTAGGNSSAGAYAAGGIFTPDANGNITGGVLDTNNAGTPTANTTLSASTYSVDSTTGRISLALGSTMTFAAYPTAANTVVMLELDSTAISSGLAYQQQGTPAAFSGNFGLSLGGQGVFYNSPGSYQPNVEGEAVLTTGSVTSGNLDINIYGTGPQPSDPITASPTSTFGSPASNGRGTATLVANDPPINLNLVYYWVNANTALFVGQDKTRVQTGIMLLQF